MARGRVPGVAVLSIVVTSTALSLTPSATSHVPRGCALPKLQPPVGDTRRAYAIPHGCIRLAAGRHDPELPTVVVRQHDRRGRLFTGRVPLPESNLDKAHGSIGICGEDSTFLFFVAYPFITIVAHELYDLGGGRSECALGLDEALMWTGRLSGAPSLDITWWTHRKAG
jgi:hypothetical protein